MGAFTQRQEAKVKNSRKELKERILHDSLCFFTFFQRKKEKLKLTSHGSKIRSRLRKGVLKHLVRKSTEELEEKIEKRKSELSAENSTTENEVDSTEKNKKRIFGLLVSMGKTVLPTSKAYAKSNDVDALRSQIEALNKSLQKQEEEKLQMRKELNKTREQVLALMQHLGFVGSSSSIITSMHHSKDE